MNKRVPLDFLCDNSLDMCERVPLDFLCDNSHGLSCGQSLLGIYWALNPINMLAEQLVVEL